MAKIVGRSDCRTVGQFLLAVLPAVMGCARHDKIVVGAKNFTESDLLADGLLGLAERRLVWRPR